MTNELPLAPPCRKCRKPKSAHQSLDDWLNSMDDGKPWHAFDVRPLPAPESLPPVITRFELIDAGTRAHVHYSGGEPIQWQLQDDGRTLKVFLHTAPLDTPPAESLPVGTDSARAEAKRRYPWRFDGQATARPRDQREAFIAGAEWARAEERKARGE